MNSCIPPNLGNYDKMGAFLKKYKLLKMTWEEIENLNRSITSKKQNLS